MFRVDAKTSKGFIMHGLGHRRAMAKMHDTKVNDTIVSTNQMMDQEQKKVKFTKKRMMEMGVELLMRSFMLPTDATQKSFPAWYDETRQVGSGCGTDQDD